MVYCMTTNALCKQYKHSKALDNLSMHVPKGSIYGFVGKNGAGKTTLIRLICGLQKVSSGGYTLYGVKNTDKEIEKARGRIGAIVEAPSVYMDMTAKENLRQQYRILGLPSYEGIDELLGLVGLADTGKKKVRNFSLGMRQRLGIAVALVGDPDFLILDEPINGLDPIGIAEVRSFIRELCKERGKTILISSHILSEISLLADDIGIIDHGVLLEEESLEQLEAKNSKYIHFIVSDAAQAARVIEQDFGTDHFTVENDHSLRLYDTGMPVAAMTRTFFENGLDVSEAHVCEDSLEDYFKRVTGGEGIA